MHLCIGTPDGPFSGTLSSFVLRSLIWSNSEILYQLVSFISLCVMSQRHAAFFQPCVVPHYQLLLIHLIRLSIALQIRPIKELCIRESFQDTFFICNSSIWTRTFNEKWFLELCRYLHNFISVNIDQFTLNFTVFTVNPTKWANISAQGLCTVVALLQLVGCSIVKG